ncbi:MAG: single-stranded DNA-binding protein [Oscillospiraceae bacterium]|jgi:single-strand DNA-binding protein|nr:single-stranded DNA-binding protein [Oscillospiraceae bacterium]
MFNKVILMGRICHDLELKSTPSGVSVLSFRIAVDRNYQVKGEERKADFFNIVAWRSTAEFVAKYFGKGRMIMVDGELQTRQYIDKNNITQNIVEIVADSIHFTGEKPPLQQQQAYQPAGGYNAYSGSYQNAPAAPHPAETVNSAPDALNGGSSGDFTESGDDDEYPF